MKKKILIISLLTLAVCGCGKVSKLSNGTDAVVSFEKMDGISVDSLYDKLKDKYAVSQLIDMIDTEILFDEYKDKEKEAKEYADSNIKSLLKNYKSEEELLSAIQNYYGFSTMNEFKEYIKLNYFRDLATNDYAKDQITDKQIDAYYEDEIVGDIEASHILITVDVEDDATSDEKKDAENKAKKEAEDIIKKLNNGEKFSDLAKAYSKDDSNKDNGGALGKFNKGEMEETFETAAYELELNKYTTTPVKTSYGYHIILKTKEYEKAKLEEVKEEIIETLSTELMNKDATTSITAMTELRKEKGMKIEDSELESSYNKYINSLYNYYLTTTSTN
ncbi:MAG: peptidylprolyl isomerase [Bacilli bacterium]|nr:peptidylprolyl isomerase [Bacilli bacterium]